MSLWVDRYRPVKIDRLDYHAQLTRTLKSLATAEDVPHLLVYGPSGAGKKTRIMAFLRELFGPGVEKLTVNNRQFQTPSGAKLELHTVSSNYHTELTPSDVGNQDRVVVQEIIKEIAQTQQIDASARHRFKVVIINEADRLSKDAQHGLRRTMEKYMGNLRIILCCNGTGKVISPIRSRCLLVRVAAPNVGEITTILQKVASKEGVNLPEALAVRFAEKSDRNLRKALLMLEAAAVQDSNLTDRQEIPLADWENFVHQIAMMIIGEQSPARLLEVRGKLYELLSHCIPADTILKSLAFDLMKHVDGSMKTEVIRHAAIYEHRLHQGQKAIYHLEAFVARFMSVYKKFLLELYG